MRDKISSSNEMYFDVVIPDASPVIHSIRAIGYIPETALADLIDNSIDAKSTMIDIKIIWNEAESYIRIEDNGYGMDESSLVRAMRLGSKDPLADRAEKELGRFGMGLKTASFSLGKRLTVLSKNNGKTHVRCWDLDTIKDTNNWLLRREAFEDSQKKLGSLSAKSGTIVVIEKLDRMLQPPYNGRSRNKFFRQLNQLEKHLQLVFHRFLEGQNRIKILLNDNPISSWDPFMSKSTLTQEMAKEDLYLDGKLISIEGYILPHHSKLTKQQYSEAAGPCGWFDQQGFYIYRNKRLLVAGGWLGLFPKDQATKLARIKVDIGQDADFDWQIDVKKSVARPPQESLEHLKRWAERAREFSHRVFYHRGLLQKKDGVSNKVDEIGFLWEQTNHRGKPYYLIHKNNPLLSRIREKCDEEINELLDVYLKLVQDTCPMNTIAFVPEESNQDENLTIIDEHKIEILKIYNLYNQMGFSLMEFIDSIKAMPIFSGYPEHAISILIKEIK